MPPSVAHAYFDPPFSPITDCLPERHSQSSVRHCQRPFLHCSDPGLRLAKTSLYLAMTCMRLCDCSLTLFATANKGIHFQQNPFVNWGCRAACMGVCVVRHSPPGTNPGELQQTGIRLAEKLPAGNDRPMIGHDILCGHLRSG